MKGHSVHGRLWWPFRVPPRMASPSTPASGLQRNNHPDPLRARRSSPSSCGRPRLRATAIAISALTTLTKPCDVTAMRADNPPDGNWTSAPLAFARSEPQPTAIIQATVHLLPPPQVRP
ncbi:hypothetical protein VTN02DRAFT_4835 [Thermoascus thermophilus]